MLESLTLTGDERLEVLQYLCFAVRDLNLPEKINDPDALQAAYALEYLDNIGRMIGGQAKWEQLLLPYCAEMTNYVPSRDAPICDKRTKTAINARTKAALFRTKPDAETLKRLTERAKAVSEAD